MPARLYRHSGHFWLRLSHVLPSVSTKGRARDELDCQDNCTTKAVAVTALCVLFIILSSQSYEH